MLALAESLGFERESHENALIRLVLQLKPSAA